jgi:hypothetical protein
MKFMAGRPSSAVPSQERAAAGRRYRLGPLVGREQHQRHDGAENQFPPPTPKARCRFGQATFPGRPSASSMPPTSNDRDQSNFEEELPRLPTGKLYKRLLRDRYWGERKSRLGEARTYYFPRTPLHSGQGSCILVALADATVTFSHVGDIFMTAITQTAEQFFKACETGQGWDGCSGFCTPEATFLAQAEPLAGINSLREYTE